MSANRKPGQPVHQKSKLRLVPSPDTRPLPTPDPELKKLLDDMNRRLDGGGRNPEDKNAA